MVREEGDPSSTPEQIQLFVQTKEKVLGMLNETEGLSEEDRDTLAGRIAGFFVEASELFKSNFNRIILTYFSSGDTSGFQLLTVFNNEPQPTGLRNLSKLYLWNGGSVIHSAKKLLKNLNGQGSEEYLRATNPRATFLGELVPAR